jgi:hypothetical protein
MNTNKITATDRQRWLKEAAALDPQIATQIIKPVGLVNFVADAAAFQGWRAEPAGAFAPRAMAEGDKIILDFGSHWVGRITLNVLPCAKLIDAPLRLRLLMGEVPLEIAAPREPFHSNMLSRSWFQEETIHLDTLPAEIVLPRRYALRYLQIEIAGLSQRHQVCLNEVRLTAESAAFDCVPAPAGLSARQQAIDAVAVRTLQNCLQSVFEDGPKRDRRLWLGDLRLQALANACTLRRFDLVKRCLLLFAALAREDGIVESCIYHVPTPTRTGNVMADYALFFTTALRDYATASGDLAGATDLWPVALHQVETITGALDASGRLPEGHPYGWCFVDWNWNLAKEGPFLGLALHTLHAAAELADILSDTAAATRLRARHGELVAIARSQWLGADGLPRDPANQQRSLALTAWFVLGGVLSGESARHALLATLADPQAQQPAGPYLWHYVLHALCLAGARDEAMARLEAYWGTMLDLGADTFWEVFNPKDHFASPYENTQLNSYCHAWSCTPSWFLRQPEAAAQR